MTVSGRRLLPVVLGVIITASMISSMLPAPASASELTQRKLTLEAVGTVGGSTPAGTVNHHFTFTNPDTTDATIKSISFKYCTKARDSSCVAPSNMSATSSTLGAVSAGLASWTKGGSTANTFYLTNSTGLDLKGLTIDITINNVLNPDTANTAFYVDINTYTSTDASTGQIDEGWVAASTANQIELQGTMPESLIFCTGDTINAPSGIPDCTSATNATVNFDQLFSPSSTAVAHSMMAASTNAGSGYVITYTGDTLKSGGNPVTPMDNGSGGATTSVQGTSQFGLNLVANTTPTVGAAITPASNGTNLRGEPITNYDTADNFKFTTSGDAVADSASGGAGGSDLQLYTVAYMVNVNGAQLAGTYTTTLTYICTPTF